MSMQVLVVCLLTGLCAAQDYPDFEVSQNEEISTATISPTSLNRIGFCLQNNMKLKERKHQIDSVKRKLDFQIYLIEQKTISLSKMKLTINLEELVTHDSTLDITANILKNYLQNNSVDSTKIFGNQISKILPSRLSRSLATLMDELGGETSLVSQVVTSVQVGELLLAAGANITAIRSIDFYPLSALEAATYYGRLSIVQWLDNVHHISNTNIGKTLEIATSKRHLNIVKYLIENSTLYEKSKHFEYLSKALLIRPSTLEIVKYLVKAGADVNFLGYFQQTVLHTAVWSNSLATVKWLIENTAVNTSLEDKYGKTALYYAAKYFDMLKYLVLEAGANPYYIDTGNRTLLHATANYYDSLTWLIDNYNIDVNAQDTDGNTVLMLTESENCLKYLIKQAKLDVNIKNNKGETILHRISLKKQFTYQLMQWLIDNSKIDINAQDTEGNTALNLSVEDVSKFLCLAQLEQVEFSILNNLNQSVLHMAAYSYRLSFQSMKWIVNNTQLDINARDMEGNTALHLSVHEVDKVQYLLEQPQVNDSKLNNDGQSVLHMAALRGSAQSVQWLLETTKLNVNTQDINGDTVLHLAVRDIDKVEIFIKLPYNDFNLKNKQGKTFLEIFEMQELPYDFQRKEKVISFVIAKIKSEE